MANFRILWNNYWDTATLTASSESDPYDYLAENTQHIWRKRTWRTQGYSSEKITGDLGSAKDIYYVVIENHNFVSGDDVHVIGSTSSTGSPAGVDITLPITSDRIVHRFDTPETYRYWLITLDRPGGASGDYFEIGNIFVGPYFEFWHQYRRKKPKFVDPSQVDETEDNQVVADERDRYRVFYFEWSPGAVKESELSDLYTIYQEVGLVKPFWIYHSPHDYTTLYYVRNLEKWEFDPVVIDYYGFSMTLKEEV